MSTQIRRRVLGTSAGCAAWAMAALLAGCGAQDSAGAKAAPAAADAQSDSQAAAADGGADAAADSQVVSCAPGTHYQPGQPWYQEATAQWGLQALEVRGTQLSVTDFDGDGRPDLLVRNGGGPDVFAPGKPERARWLLRNTGTGFEDVTEKSGLFVRRTPGPPGATHPGSTLASADVDNDGDVDVYVATGADGKGGAAEPSSELYLNDGKGHFSLGPADSAARMQGLPAVPMGVAFVDYDRDGVLDLFVTHNMPGAASSPLQDRLLRGKGDGRFADVSQAAGLLTLAWNGATVAQLNQAKGHSWAWSAAACDLNGDGWPELLASSYGRAPNHLWQAAELAGKRGYLNASVSSGYAYDQGVDWTDNESARCHCKDVPGDPECGKVPKPTLDCAQLKLAFGGSYRWDHVGDRQPWRLGGNSGTTICADVNNDGHLDLLTNEIKHWDVGSSSDLSELLLNLGSADIQFDRPGNEATGLTRDHAAAGWDEGHMTSAIFDFDNDGWPDVYIGASDYPDNRALLWRQDAPGHFVALPTTDFFDHHRAQGNAVADFDGDGDLDIAVGHAHMRCEGQLGKDCYPTQQVRLFLNQRGQAGHWLQLDLQGSAGSNRQAIGARVRVTAGGVTQTAEVDGGHGQGGLQRHQMQHFGLGGACSAQVEVRWPDATGTLQTATLQAGKRWKWLQGGAPVQVATP